MQKNMQTWEKFGVNPRVTVAPIPDLAHGSRISGVQELAGDGGVAGLGEARRPEERRTPGLRGAVAAEGLGGARRRPAAAG